jgi:hypothetical protein
VRLVLDEHWPPEIAVQLRHRGLDVIAASETEHAGRYRGIPDDLVFERAQEDGRAVVTDNVADFETIRLECEHQGRRHFGVVHARAPQFDRHQPELVVGLMVRALQLLLESQPSNEPASASYWLRRPEVSESGTGT